MPLIVLGVDPGLADLGWGVLSFTLGVPAYVAHGVVKTPAGGEELARVRTIMREVRRLIAVHRVDAVGFEAWNYYTGQTTTAAHPIGLVIGAILGVAPCPVHSAGTAAEWRRSLGLPHQCTKAFVQKHVQQKLSLPKPPTPQHASDALAVALATFPKL